MTPEQRQAARARCEAATYDLMHTCLDYCFCDPPGRCYHGDTDEMCRYEPRCHDQHQDRMGIRPRLVQPAVLLSDITLALDEIDRLEAERNAAYREIDKYETTIDNALDELGVPTLDYPAPVSNAWTMLWNLRHPDLEGRD